MAATFIQGDWIRSTGDLTIINEVDNATFAENSTFALNSSFSGNTSFANKVNCVDIVQGNGTIGDFCNPGTVAGGAGEGWIVNGTNVFNNTPGVQVGINTNNPRGFLEIDTGLVHTNSELVRYYRFEDNNTFELAVDSAKNENATIEEAVFVPSKGGNLTGQLALQFDGINDAVFFDGTDALTDIPTFTIGVWINASVLQDSSVYDISTVDASVSRVRLSLNSDSSINFSARALDDGPLVDIQTSTGMYTPGEYVLIIVTVNYGTSNITIYRDSIVNESVSVNFNASRTDITDSAKATIGSNANRDNFRFNGTLDEFILINLEAEQSAITQFFLGNEDILKVSDSFIVTSDGKVGINTNNPTERLVVDGNSKFFGDVRILGTLRGGSPLKIAGGIDIINAVGNSTFEDVQISGTIHGGSPVKINGGLQVDGPILVRYENGTREDIRTLLIAQQRLIRNLTDEIDILKRR